MSHPRRTAKDCTCFCKCTVNRIDWNNPTVSLENWLACKCFETQSAMRVVM